MMPKSNLSRRRSAHRHNAQPVLTFTPTAWAKLIYLRDYGDTEVGGFGIAAGNDLLRVTDVQLVRQRCTSVTVAFDDEAVADHVDHNIDAGLTPAQCLRIWVHTHPGDSAQPSSTDEDTFARVFGACDWAIMFILAQHGETYCRLRFNAGPGGELELPVAIDYAEEFDGTDWAAWEAEYEANVSPVRTVRRGTFVEEVPDLLIDRQEAQLRDMWLEDWEEYITQQQAEELYDFDNTR
jgi:proteasome lid subunit RPN8/RPN11